MSEIEFEKLSYYDLMPKSHVDVDNDNLSLFFKTMHERQEIWYKKTFLKKQPPWTEDPYFSKFNFTNVYRELDKSSQYLIKNSYLKENDMKQIFFSILVHRVLNKAETIEAIGGYPHYKDFNLKKFVSKLQSLENSGFKTLNDDAYKINTYVWQGEPRWKAYAENIIGVYHNRLDIMYDIVKYSTDIKQVIQTMKIFGVGMFLFHEYYQDMCDVKIYKNEQLFNFDRNSWTNVGPGCAFGMRLIFPSLPQQDSVIYMLRDIAPTYLPKNFKYVYWSYRDKKYKVLTGVENCNITAHQIEMWLCEFGKYWKMMNKVGKSRKKYTQG